ncbi:MAG: hypothetical protein H7145_06355 [Akkermansiaceae bacterium]|nr:hypothetical protein [Armatimonadota bacterium]
MSEKKDSSENGAGSDLLSSLIGKKVVIIGHNDGHTRDEGVFSGFDGTVLFIRSKDLRGRVRHLYFPLRNVRLIEMIDEP